MSKLDTSKISADKLVEMILHLVDLHVESEEIEPVVILSSLLKATMHDFELYNILAEVLCQVQPHSSVLKYANECYGANTIQFEHDS